MLGADAMSPQAERCCQRRENSRSVSSPALIPHQAGVLPSAACFFYAFMRRKESIEEDGDEMAPPEEDIIRPLRRNHPAATDQTAREGIQDTRLGASQSLFWDVREACLLLESSQWC